MRRLILVARGRLSGAVAAVVLTAAVAAGAALGTSCGAASHKSAASFPPLKVDPFAGLEPLGADTEQRFTFRRGPAPPPDLARREQLPFPPPPAPKSGDAKSAAGAKRPAPGRLRVLRFSPRGDVRNVGAVTVSFDQPMIPVASLETLASIGDPPVQLTPRPPGRFRWLGTQTLAFEPSGDGPAGGRMPFGTDYAVTIPQGTRSALGGLLERAVRFAFSTPRPELVRALPSSFGDQTRPDTAIALLFNQVVDPRQVLELMQLNQLRAGDVRLVPPKQWDGLRDLGLEVATWDPARAVVLQPVRPLQKDTAYRLQIASGLRGEGPRRTARTLHHHFRTYAPLRVDRIECAYYGECRPEAGFTVQLNNPVVTEDVARFIDLKPAVEDFEAELRGAAVVLRGDFAPQTAYVITVKPGLVDIHDQRLEQGRSATLRTGDLAPQLSFPAQGLVSLERSGARQVPLEVAGVSQARLRLVKVAPEQLFDVINKAHYSWDEDGRRDPLAGIQGVKVRRTLATGVGRNGKKTLALHPDEALGRRGAGVVYFELRSDELKRQSRWANPFRGLVVQVTDLGLMARYGDDQILALVTDLRGGAPVTAASALLRDRTGQVIWRGKSDRRGLIEAPGRRVLGKSAPYVLWVRHRGDEALLILDESGDDGGYVASYSSWGSPPEAKQVRMHLFTDRSPYRPGEQVHIKGVLRVVDQRPQGGVEALPADSRAVRYEVKGPRGHKIKEGEAALSAGDAFGVDVAIPEGADLGAYQVAVMLQSGPYAGRWLTGSFEVQEYRAPEFKVQVQVEGEPLFIGQQLSAQIGADYLFGAPMAGASCKWTLARKETSFAPPGQQPGFAFGDPVPLEPDWLFTRHLRVQRGGPRPGYGFVRPAVGPAGELVADGEGRLDAAGRLGLHGPLLARDAAAADRGADKGADKGADRGADDGRNTRRAPGEEPRVGPLAFTLEAEVIDQNRQTIADRKTVTVHPAGLYVGLRAPKSVIKAGDAVKVEAVLVDLAGKRLAGRKLAIEALAIDVKVKTVFVDGSWTYEYERTRRKVGGCDVQSSADAASCELVLPRPGGYELRAAATDERGRRTRTMISAYAFGPGYVPWDLRNQSRIELVPDKVSYQPGDVAKVLIRSPLSPARGLLTIQRGGIERYELLDLQGSAHVVEVPIAAHHLPEVYVAVGLARGRVDAPRQGAAGTAGTMTKAQLKDLGRPTFAHGLVRLPVSIASKQVTVKVTPSVAALGPGEQLTVRLRASDAAGRPVAAELAVMAVDEGVLSLLGYATPDPLAVFHAGRAPDAALADLRNALLGKPDQKLAAERKRQNAQQAQPPRSESSRLDPVNGLALRARRMAPVAVRGSSAEPAGGVAFNADNIMASSDVSTRAGLAAAAPAHIRSRTNFATTAYHDPSVLLDARGEGQVTFKLPDTLTTYRIMAVALDRGQADRFGNGEAQVKVRQPLLLRASLPRFLSVGDRFEAAVMVHNETDRDGLVDVLVRGRNAVPTAASRKRVSVARHGAKEVRFAMHVERAGPARIQFGAVLGGAGDAVEKQLPVLLPATTEAFATYGATDESVVQPVVPPKGVLPGYGGLEVSLSSTALNGLEDAVSYLVSYPYECTEQTASRLLPIFSLKRILDEFDIASIADRKQRDALARAGVRKLVSSQRWDGGWGNWQGSELSWLYTSAYATYALLRGKAEGEAVDASALDRARRFLKQRLDAPVRELGERYDWVGQVAAAWVLSAMGQHERAHLDRLYELRSKLPLFARAWLMVALYRAEQGSSRVLELLRELDNAAVQTASAARFAEGDTESLRLLMHSDDRTDAIVLAALLEVAPGHALLPKVARGLLQARIKGHWSTTQANAYALVALSDYYRKQEIVTPDFIGRLWYGDGYLGEGKFKGRELRIVEQQLPLAALDQAGARELVVAKHGPGRLYYRIGLRYAPADLRLPPAEEGFSVARTYEAVADPKGRPQDTVRRAPDGTWEIAAGATVRVRLVVVVPDQRYFVAVVDPLPAGLEGINLQLKTSASAALAGRIDDRVYDSWSWYSLLAFDHREMRDDRVVLFADRLPAGVYEYTYLARATSYGEFVAAPAKAEEMYRPETFGRSRTTFVRIK